MKCWSPWLSEQDGPKLTSSPAVVHQLGSSIRTDFPLHGYQHLWEVSHRHMYAMLKIIFSYGVFFKFLRLVVSTRRAKIPELTEKFLMLPDKWFLHLLLQEWSNITAFLASEQHPKTEFVISPKCHAISTLHLVHIFAVKRFAVCVSSSVCLVKGKSLLIKIQRSVYLIQ